MSNTAPAAWLSVAVMGLTTPIGRWSTDMDNIEDGIATGATRTSVLSRPRSVLIEVDSQDAARTASVERILGVAGSRLVSATPSRIRASITQLSKRP